GDAAQEYFVDGMTDGLTASLAQIDGLQVISRTSAMQFKGTTKRLPEVGKELSASGIVEGSITKSADHLRLTAELIQASTDRHVWARTYECNVRDVLPLQNEIARAIAEAAGVAGSSSAARHATRHDVDPEAYDAYLKGVYASGRENVAGFRNAVGYFEEAIAKQPDFAMAYAALAQAQLQFIYSGRISPRDTIPKAEAAARKAIALDDTL